MRSSVRLLIAAAMTCATVSFIFATPAQTLNRPDVNTYNIDDDEEDSKPDVTARVARISFIRGDVQIRHAGDKDWERAVLNLPIVEGDEVSTGQGSRLEIQFSKASHLRLNENAYMRVVVLKDEGIALSLSEGTLNVRITSFEKDKTYFEIDAPKTTLAVQKTGSYRIDAGKVGDPDLRVSIREGGEARVYSDNAGFTLKSGRGARVFLEGNNAGDWETADAARSADEFDQWTLDRDDVIAKRLKDAYYDKYYDADIYGADDLNDYGQWVHTGNYGYVWRPYPSAIASYADWSPYRYGHWRWVSPFGWVWVNDEPWGWATYHYGRWIYDDGYWAWAPYGYYRQTRSWWFPALVVINIIDNNVCWYPLGYHHHYYNYNANFHNGRHHNNNPPNPGPTGGIKPIPTRRPPDNGGVAVNKNGPGRHMDGGPQRDVIPPRGVITTDKKDFGTNPRGIRPAPPLIAGNVLRKDPLPTDLPDLPDRADLSGRIGREIMASPPQIDRRVANTRVGAGDRRSGGPLDQELRNTRMFGGRPPVEPPPDTGGVKEMPNNRKPGAIDRQPPITGDDTRRARPPVYSPPQEGSGETQAPPVRKPPVNSPPKEAPVDKESAPVRTPPRRQPPENPPEEKPTRKPGEYSPPQRQPPQNDSPPPRNDSPKQPPKSESPPAKTEPVKKPDDVAPKRKDGGR